MLISLIFLLVATAMSVALLFVLTSLVHSKAAGVREWTQGNGVAVLALVLVAVRDRAPDILSFEVANGLLMITLGLIYAGFRRHLALAVPTLPLVLGGVLALGGFVFFHYVFDSAALRILSVSIYHAALCFAIVATVPPTSDPYLRYPFVFTRVAALALGAANAFRGALFALQSAEPAISIDIATWNLVFLACGTLAFPALTLGAVMMANAQALREAAYAADHDHLTDAWTRRAFITFAEQEHARAERRYNPLSLLVIDADHVKRINDTHGHALGDRVLRDIVMHTQEVIRKIDYCGRLGGGEFAVLLPDATQQTAMEVAARLRTALDRSLSLGPSTVPVAYTVSIGVATLALGETLAGLMARADAALHAAKAKGRNRVVSAPLPPRVENTAQQLSERA
jgi:diguanylate cyclase (GGDEF)-like protein